MRRRTCLPHLLGPSVVPGLSLCWKKGLKLTKNMFFVLVLGNLCLIDAVLQILDLKVSWIDSSALQWAKAGRFFYRHFCGDDDENDWRCPEKEAGGALLLTSVVPQPPTPSLRGVSLKLFSPNFKTAKSPWGLQPPGTWFFFRISQMGDLGHSSWSSSGLLLAGALVFTVIKS